MSKSGLPWSKFFWSDWEADEGLRQCSLAAQGLWMRMLCICAKGDPPGYLSVRGEALPLEGIARAGGIDTQEAKELVDELAHWGVFSRDRKGRIYSRRMVKDEKKSKIGKKYGKKGGNPSLTKTKENPPTLNPLDNPRDNGGGYTQKPEARSQNNSYRFSGSVIRLNDADFDQWEKAYPHIPDLAAELQSLDDWFKDNPPKNWFPAVSGALRKRNQRYAQEARDSPRSPHNPHEPGSVAYLRWEEKHRNNGGKRAEG